MRGREIEGEIKGRRKRREGEREVGKLREGERLRQRARDIEKEREIEREREAGTKESEKQKDI